MKMQGRGKELDIDIIRVEADIHPNGDVYVKDKKGTFWYVGCLGESDFKNIPDYYYQKVKKICSKHS